MVGVLLFFCGGVRGVMHVSLDLWLSVCLSIHPSIHPSVSQSVSQSISQTDSQTSCLSGLVCLCLCLSVCICLLSVSVRSLFRSLADYLTMCVRPSIISSVGSSAASWKPAAGSLNPCPKERSQRANPQMSGRSPKQTQVVDTGQPESTQRHLFDFMLS